jgi:hypothetical protein
MLERTGEEDVETGVRKMNELSGADPVFGVFMCCIVLLKGCTARLAASGSSSVTC